MGVESGSKGEHAIIALVSCLMFLEHLLCYRARHMQLVVTVPPTKIGAGLS